MKRSKILIFLGIMSVVLSCSKDMPYVNENSTNEKLLSMADSFRIDSISTDSVFHYIGQLHNGACYDLMFENSLTQPNLTNIMNGYENYLNHIGEVESWGDPHDLMGDQFWADYFQDTLIDSMHIVVDSLITQAQAYSLSYVEDALVITKDFLLDEDFEAFQEGMLTLKETIESTQLYLIPTSVVYDKQALLSLGVVGVGFYSSEYWKDLLEGNYINDPNPNDPDNIGTLAPWIAADLCGAAVSGIGMAADAAFNGESYDTGDILWGLGVGAVGGSVGGAYLKYMGF